MSIELEEKITVCFGVRRVRVKVRWMVMRGARRRGRGKVFRASGMVGMRGMGSKILKGGRER